MAESKEHEYLLPDLDKPINFYCECSDETCTKRIKLTPSLYTQRHQNSSQFIICLGHNVPKVERMVKTEENFAVVEKFMTPPDGSDTLHATNIDNS